MSSNLENFIEEILAISPQYINVFGTGLPGLSGGSAAVQGAASSGSEIALELQHQTADFVHLYADQKVRNTDLELVAHQIEASLMSLQTLSVLNDTQTSKLIDELYDLVEARNKE